LDSLTLQKVSFFEFMKEYLNGHQLDSKLKVELNRANQMNMLLYRQLTQANSPLLSRKLRSEVAQPPPASYGVDKSSLVLDMTYNRKR